jgi:T-complex protein 1 subunit gamma
MLKMLMDPVGGIVMTNDGNAILREIDVVHPAAKSMIELARSQDEEVGDGTTSVIILAGEMLSIAEPFLVKEFHPTLLVNAYYRALEDSLKIAEDIATPIDLDSDKDLSTIIKCCLGTKFSSKWDNLISDLALKAVKIVNNRNSPVFYCDIKKFAKVEKVPGATLQDCCVLNGIMLNKDLVHPQMRRRIEKPRILLMDSNLEYKKGESQLMEEMSKENNFSETLEQERKEIRLMCETILRWKPDILVTEKGVSDLAAHYLQKGNCSVIRRLRKTDNNRLAKVCGATIVNRPEEIQESDIGTKCGLFEVRKLGDEYFSYFLECENPKACTILLRGASKDVLNEMERNLTDALNVGRNMFANPKLVPGGGAFEMEVSSRLLEKSKNVEGLLQLPYQAVASALEVIPRTLSQNCGAEVVRVITDLRAKHADTSDENHIYYGINGVTGRVDNMKNLNIWDTLSVKKQTLKTAVEVKYNLLIYLVCLYDFKNR